MPHDRYFIESSLEEGLEVTLKGEEAHHLHVMRKKCGDFVELVNGKNTLAIAKIVHQEKRDSILSIQTVHISSPLSSLILAQAIPRLNRLDGIIEKGTELGATAFYLFPSERSEKKNLKDNEIERLRRITISAMKQCGRLDLPEIMMKPSLSEFQELQGDAYFGDLSDDAPLFSKVWKKSEQIVFFVGPEAGFSTKEQNQLKILNAQAVCLHPHILRTDTAPLVALSLIRHWQMIP